MKEDALEQKKYPDVSGFFDKDLLLTPEMVAEDYLLEMPQPYFFSGSSKSEISYEDAYWIMLGLGKMGRIDKMRAMMDNFSSWTNAYGYIPGGNRANQWIRFSPPMFALMIELLAKYDGQAAYRMYFKVMETEYQFWMKGEIQVYKLKEPVKRVVLLPEKNAVLNRYWDEKDMPRSEYYALDIALAKAGNVINSLVYRNVCRDCTGPPKVGQYGSQKLSVCRKTVWVLRCGIPKRRESSFWRWICSHETTCLCSDCSTAGGDGRKIDLHSFVLEIVSECSGGDTCDLKKSSV